MGLSPLLLLLQARCSEHWCLLLLTRCCSRSTLESSPGIHSIFTFLQQRIPLIGFVIIISLSQLLCSRFSYHCELPFLLPFSSPSDLPTLFLVPEFIAIPSHRCSSWVTPFSTSHFISASAVVSLIPHCPFHQH